MDPIFAPILELGGLLAAGPMEHVLDVEYEGLKALGITKHVTMMLLAAVICLTLFPMVARRVASGNPGRLATAFEAVLIFLREEMVRPFLGKDTNRFLPILWSFFFFIFFCNMLGMIPLPFMGTATGNINVTAALATIAFGIYHFHGVKENGFFHYVKANLLVGPWFLWPLMIPLELIGHAIKPAALMIRLFANMMGGHILLAVIIGFTGVYTAWDDFAAAAIALVAVGGGIFVTGLELIVATVQAIVFTFLLTVFLSMALHPDH